MNERQPLTPNEVIHQSLLDQLELVPPTNNDVHLETRRRLGMNIEKLIERQIVELFPNIYQKDSMHYSIRMLSQTITDTSIREKRFIPASEIKAHIEESINRTTDKHFKNLFEGIGGKGDEFYFQNALNDLKNPLIHHDHAERIIKSFINREQTEKIEEDLRTFPFYPKLFSTEKFFSPHRDKLMNASANLALHCVKYNLPINAEVYLSFFGVYVLSFVREFNESLLPRSIVVHLAGSASDKGFTENHRLEFYRFIEKGTRGNIKELCEGLKPVEGFEELPTNVADLDEYFANHPHVLHMFMGNLRKAILAGNGYKPTITSTPNLIITF